MNFPQLRVKSKKLNVKQISEVKFSNLKVVVFLYTSTAVTVGV